MRAIAGFLRLFAHRTGVEQKHVREPGSSVAEYPASSRIFAMSPESYSFIWQP